MDSSVSTKDEIWFLCVYNHISNAVDKLVCTPLYLKLPEDGFSAPKCVGVFETYVHFVNILLAIGDECD